MKIKPTQSVILLLTLLMALVAPAPVAASGGIVYGDSIPSGTVIDGDVLLIGQNISLDGTVNGNVFILGNQAAINGKVDGSLVLVSQNASIGGSVSGAVYALALTLDLPAQAALERDLYAATVSLTSGTGSVIGRHLYAIGLDSGLNGEIGGTLHTVIGPIQLYNGLMTLLGFDELTLKLRFDLPTPAPDSSGSLPSNGRHARLVLNLEPAPIFDWGAWALTLLRSWAVLFIFGLLMLWLVRKPLERSGKPIAEHPWQMLGIGLLGLVLAFAVVAAALLVAGLIFAIGLGFAFLGLWQVSVAIWLVSFACLILALVAWWLFITYGTKIIFLYFVSSWIFNKLFHQKAVWLKVLALLAGTVLYILFRAVPYVGWVFGVLITAAGIGSAWLAWRDAGKTPPTVQIEKTIKSKKKKVIKKQTIVAPVQGENL